MTRRVPPLECIEAFVLASRCQSFREAAERSALSASAFTRRIQKLERFVGMPLFVRGTAALQLTATGAGYLAEIESAMTVIRQATVRLRSIRRHGKLRLMVSQSFATGWLVRRLSELYARGVDEIELHIGRDLQRLRAGEVDVAILGGDLELRELSAECLIQLRAVVVTAPSLMESRTPPASIADLRDHRLLAMDFPADVWQRWLTEAGCPHFPLNTPTRFESLLLMYEAAASGLGIALAIPIIADGLMREGRLRPCFPTCLPIGTGYSMVYADDAVKRRPDVQTLRSWVSENFRKCELEFEQHVSRASGALSTRPPLLDPEARDRPARAVRIRKTVHAS